MSKETMQWLNTMILRGMTDLYSNAWWRNDELQQMIHTGASGRTYTGTHYTGAIPVGDIIDRFQLFREDMVGGRVAVEVPADLDTMTHLDDNMMPVRWAVQDDRKGIVAPDGSVLGLHSATYKIHNYREWLINNVSAVLGDTLRISSVGLLKGGAVAWVQATPESGTITGPDGFTVVPHVMATTSTDGSVATTYTGCSTFVECDNTHRMALRENNPKYKRKHTRYSDGQMAQDEARRVLGIVNRYADDLRDEMELLASIPVSRGQWTRIVEELAPYSEDAKTSRARTMADKKRSELDALWLHDSRVSPMDDHGLKVVQAASTWSQWIRKVGRADTDRTERRMMDLIDGSQDKMDGEAVAALVKVVPAARELIGAGK